VGVLIAIPALNVAARAVGLVAARVKGEASTPARGVSGSDRFLDGGVGDLGGDSFPSGERGAINRTGGMSLGVWLGCGLSSVKLTFADLTVEAKRPEAAAVDVCAHGRAINVGGRREGVGLLAIVVVAAFVFSLMSDITLQDATFVLDVGLDTRGELLGAARDVTIDVSGEGLFTTLPFAQPALLGTVLQTISPVRAVRGLGTRIGARSIRNRDPLVGFLAIVEETTG